MTKRLLLGVSLMVFGQYSYLDNQPVSQQSVENNKTADSTAKNDSSDQVQASNKDEKEIVEDKKKKLNKTAKNSVSPYNYESSEQISEDLSVSFPVDI